MLNESRVGRTLLSAAFDFEPHNFLDPQRAIRLESRFKNQNPRTRGSAPHRVNFDTTVVQDPRFRKIPESLSLCQSITYDWPFARYIRSVRNRRELMELVFTTVAVIGGMTYSLAVAILVEELIFGKVLGVFFTPRAHQPKTAVQR